MLLKGQKDTKPIIIKIKGSEVEAIFAKSQLEGALLILDSKSPVARETELEGERVSGSGMIAPLGAVIDFKGTIEWCRRLQLGNEERTVIAVNFDADTSLPVNYVALAMAQAR